MTVEELAILRRKQIFKVKRGNSAKRLLLFHHLFLSTNLVIKFSNTCSSRPIFQVLSRDSLCVTSIYKQSTFIHDIGEFLVHET